MRSSCPQIFSSTCLDGNAHGRWSRFVGEGDAQEPVCHGGLELLRLDLGAQTPLLLVLDPMSGAKSRKRESALVLLVSRHFERDAVLGHSGELDLEYPNCWPVFEPRHVPGGSLQRWGGVLWRLLGPLEAMRPRVFCAQGFRDLGEELEPEGLPLCQQSLVEGLHHGTGVATTGRARLTHSRAGMGAAGALHQEHEGHQAHSGSGECRRGLHCLKRVGR
mmetsp:Transcript_24685/g.72386  ORF Transcript_24685/g.72386 Transcript_24685/m.72386 type:complete len:219 (-) Transcript_24685:494-1150(-)